MSITSLIQPGQIAALATPSNLRLGQQIVTEGGVEQLPAGPEHIKARVGKVSSAGQMRTVELFAGEDGLEWSCTCTRRRDIFCKALRGSGYRCVKPGLAPRGVPALYLINAHRWAP